MRVLGLIRCTELKNIEAVQYYRAYLPLREVGANTDIEAAYIDTVAIINKKDSELGGFDIYAMCRMYHEDFKDFIGFIHKSGVLVFDSDDDLTEDYRLVSGHGRAFKAMLGAVDYVTTSTPELAEHLGKYTKVSPIVLPNHIDVEGFGQVADSADRFIADVTVGFSGTKTHWGDWYTAVVPWVRIISDYEMIPLVHGSPPEYIEFARTVRLPQTPYREYPASLAQFDILLCAVNTADPFNAGKSGIKALEAMVAGAVPICSKLPAYQRLDEGAPIVMVEEDSQDGWYEAMRGLITDEERRLHLKSQGRQWVTDNRDMGTSGYRHWAEAYQGMVSDGQ